MEDSLGLGMSPRVSTQRRVVLILVVMEDSLGPKERNIAKVQASVLILVVMEDSLGRILQGSLVRNTSGLNPCCNGR